MGEESHASPRVILGTMTIGNQVDSATAADLVGTFLSSGRSEIDTAYGYAEGATENILGTILPRFPRNAFSVATKANPSAKGSLSAEAVSGQLHESLSRLRISSADLFYLHQPDPKTPVEITLRACDQLARQGKFRELGLSNYASWQVADIVHRCRREGWVVPTVYQGMYNALTRDVERELFPCLHEFGIRFYAYNPLAGGLLSGRYHRGQTAPSEGRGSTPSEGRGSTPSEGRGSTPSEGRGSTPSEGRGSTPSEGRGSTPSEGRFAVYRFYVDRYWKSSYLGAAERIAGACEREAIPPARAALRWMMHHSALEASRGDGVILGVSRPAHLSENLAACAESPLPSGVVEAFKEAWEMARPDCPKYFRP